MTGNKKKQTKELFQEIYKHPSYVNELSEYQKSKVLEYVANQIDQCAERTMKLLSADYNYPDYVDDDKKADYWLNRSSKYKKAKRVKAIIEDKSDAENDEPEDDKKKEPWDRIDGEAQNRITTFLSGKRQNNKECYRFLLSYFELNRGYIEHGDAQAVIDLANGEESYAKIENKPGEQSQRKQVKKYMNRYNSP